MMVDAIEIGYAIKDRRAELGLTQAQLAEAAGVSKRCLWSLELGLNPGVQLDKLTAVLGALNLDLVLAPCDVSDSPACVAVGTASDSKAANNEDRVTSNGGVPASKTDAADSVTVGIDAFSILTGGAK